jgi:hypothetical protein
MQYRYKPRTVDAAQWSTGRPGDVIGMLANHGVTPERNNDVLIVPTISGDTGISPTAWVVVDEGEVAVYSDAEFRDLFEARDLRGGSVSNAIGGPMSGTVIQTGGDYHGDLRF